ncbi:endoplasmic reticulum-based factor for assembly of V-ATPase-domain-containing protein [Radiomyces spectabilis]|uniref:endoplasmic reticulum-based factor for assembly of V-ATPase-domain-containing protein n=1 Tax=Radiomyces spectabilis TaxID=64574 RepID=UPI00221FDA54|nr:endoplasmic reticulum-based factor for assembly of V-ATPase-domain-containing protein [Radiomyces spectabilis]KAI8384755.1 endoplasmic reticulum-based factor for assembly of V-ATPase-domain-containing protein [Radiomyces spectabilis]
MQLRLTKNIQEAVHAALAGEDFPLKYKEEAEQVASISLEKPSGISLDLLKLIAQYLDRSSVEQDRTWFHELIRGTEVYVEPKEPPPKNPEFEAYMEQLRAQQREKEYAKMVSSVVTSEDDKYMYSLRPNELKEIKGHVTTILNIAFSMVAVYVAVYMAAKTMTQDVGTVHS